MVKHRGPEVTEGCTAKLCAEVGLLINVRFASKYPNPWWDWGERWRSLLWNWLTEACTGSDICGWDAELRGVENRWTV